jgi:hypothetical protein
VIPGPEEHDRAQAQRIRGNGSVAALLSVEPVRRRGDSRSGAHRNSRPLAECAMLFVTKFNVRQVSDGPRSVQTGSFRRYEIEVITGYDAINDRFPIHIRAHRSDQPWQRIDSSHAWGTDESDAFQKGWEIVAGWAKALDEPPE